MLVIRHCFRDGLRLTLILIAAWSTRAQWAAAAEIKPVVELSADGSKDQDDMCIWVHPSDTAQSTIITSDKEAYKIFVYDLAGNEIQSLSAKHPGNIDVRYGFPLGGKKVDIVAVNVRDTKKIMVLAVDPATRKLQRVDDNAIRTDESYGGCLFVSPKTGKFFYFGCLNDDRGIVQFELIDNGAGKVSGKKVRSWKKISQCEGAVGDDENGIVYIGEERRGVWAVGGEPDDPKRGKLIAKVGENGLKKDVEGVAIYHLPGGKGWLLVSSQGSHNFKVYRRGGDHKYLGTFSVAGAEETDGIEVSNVNFGAAFPAGFFACHTDKGKLPTLLVPWPAVAKAVGLQVDTTWNPRK